MGRSRANTVVSGKSLSPCAAATFTTCRFGRRGAFHDWALQALCDFAAGRGFVAGCLIGNA
jgi:hypothetical protein